MGFNIVLKFDDGGAPAKVAAIEAALGRAAAATDRTTASMTQLGRAAADAGTQIAAAGDKAAAGHGKAKAAVDDHGDSLTKLIHLAEAYVAVHQIESIVDGYIELDNKLRVVSTSQANLNGLMAATFAVAQETRSNWEDVASTYQRLGTVTKGLGLSQQEVIGLTREMALAAKIGGATNREAGAAMGELTHAFATGTMQGREFRVLMRDVPSLMHELQVASGKTGSEFAEMGKKGGITAQLLIDWFGKAGPALEEKFGKTIPTIADGFLLIRNAAEKFFGEAAVGSGVVGELGSALRFVATHFETIAKVALGVGEALVGLFVIEKITVMIRALTVAIASNPLGALLIVVTAGIALLRQFGDEINTSKQVWTNVNGVFVTVGDSLNALWVILKEVGAEIGTFISEAWTPLAKGLGDGFDSGRIGDTLTGVLRMIAGFVGGARALIHMFTDDSAHAFDALAYTIVEALTKALNLFMDGVTKAGNALRHMVFEYIHGTADKRLEAMDESSSEFNRLAPKRQQDIIDSAKASTHYNQSWTGVGEQFQPGTRAELDAEIERRVKGLQQTTLENAYEKRGLTDEGRDPRDVDVNPFKRLENPLKGSAIGKSAEQGYDQLGKAAEESMKHFDDLTHQIAAARVSDTGPGSTVSTDKGSKEAVAETEKAAHAREKLINELRAIEEQSNPVVAAQEKLAHAQDIVTRATNAGIISWAQGNTVMDDYRRKVADTIDPMGAWVTKTIASTASLKANAQEMQRDQEVLTFEREMKEKGIVLTDAQIQQATHLIAVAQQRAEQMRAEQGIYQTMLGPQHTYEVQLAAADDLQAKGTISAKQYGQAVDNARLALLASTDAGKTFVGGMEAGWIKLKQEADALGATIATTLLGDLDKLNQTLVEAANGAQVSWSNFFSTALQGLEQVLLKALEVKAVNAIMNMGGGGAGTVAGTVADLVGTLSGGSAPANATGGQYVVGGSGGTDSHIAQLRVTPGETITVQTPEQRRADGGASGESRSSPTQAAPVVTNHIHNHIDDSVVTAALPSRAGERAVSNILRRQNYGMKRR